MHGVLLLVALTALQDGGVGPDVPRTEERRSSSAPTPLPRMDPVVVEKDAPLPDGKDEPAPAPRKEDLVLRWNRAALDAIRVEKTTPPEAARHLALLHITIYDSVIAIYRTHRPYRFEEKLSDSA